MPPAAYSLAFLFLLPATAQTAEQPFHRAELIFPLEHWHNHASSIVELPNGDLFVCWYHGSGERSADDVIVQGSRRRHGQAHWSRPFVLADTPNFPDTNPALFVDSRRQLWLLWPVILANEWHTALMKYKVSTDYQRADRPPRWDRSDNLLVVPAGFGERVKEIVEPALAASEGQRAAALKRLLERASDKYFSRLGWMTRAHPLELASGRILVPLYSDGYSFSLIAITDDGGLTWRASEPLVGYGAIQPTLVRRRDGVLVAYMRDNGPPPKRIHVSTSSDQGLRWSPVIDTDLPNPGSGLEVIALKDGAWAMVYNDTERGRHSLAVALSQDEGKTWKWKRHLEIDTRPTAAGSFHYPSIVQAQDGRLHVSYSYFLNHLPAGAPRKSIKHAEFNRAWVQQGDPAR